MINLRQKLKSKKVRSKSFLAALIIIIATICGLVMFLQKREDAKIIFNENKVERGYLEIKVLATGTVQPQNRLEIKPPIPGRVEDVLIEEGQYVKKGQILAWMSSTERAALLDAARAKGIKEIRKWEEIYPATPILAPISGTIILKNVESGETFTSSDSLLAMSDRLTVKAQVDETDIASINLKQSAEIRLDAYPDHKIPGIVDKIAFEATTVSNVTTYIVDVLPKDVPPFMKSGMTANVSFVVNSKKDILLIPSEAIKMQDGRTTVLINLSKKQIEKEVEIGLSDGKKTEILSGLKEGDAVLTAQIKLEKDGKSGSNPFNPRGNMKKR